MWHTLIVNNKMFHCITSGTILNVSFELESLTYDKRVHGAKNVVNH